MWPLAVVHHFEASEIGLNSNYDIFAINMKKLK